MAGKATKQKNREQRAKAKAARKASNYLKFGPKESGKSRGKNKNGYGSHKSGPPRSEPVKLAKPSAKTKANRRKALKGTPGAAPNFPLRPLRRRLSETAKKKRAQKIADRISKKICISQELTTHELGEDTVERTQ